MFGSWWNILQSKCDYDVVVRLFIICIVKDEHLIIQNSTAAYKAVDKIQGPVNRLVGTANNRSSK